MLTVPTSSTLTEEIIAGYSKTRTLSPAEMTHLLVAKPAAEDEMLMQMARDVTQDNVGDLVHLRAIIEFSNVCQADCLYCGIRNSADAERFVLSQQTILDTAEEAFKHYPGLLLQSGEVCSEAFVSQLVDTVKKLKARAKEVSPLGEKFRIILSVGELTKAQYKQLHDAGADRYLLRIETANQKLYKQIHDASSSFERRKECLLHLRDLGYAVGTGSLIGLPNQTAFDLARDVSFFKHIGADMIGMGPYIPAPGTPLAEKYDLPTVLKDLQSEDLFQTVRRMIAVTRLVNPKANISATTAMEVLKPENGRILAMQAGANVIMPVLTPKGEKQKYALYKGKSDVKSSQEILLKQIAAAGRTCDLLTAGDPVSWAERQ